MPEKELKEERRTLYKRIKDLRGQKKPIEMEMRRCQLRIWKIQEELNHNDKEVTGTNGA